MEKFDRANYVKETTFPNDSEVPRETSQKRTKFRDRLARRGNASSLTISEKKFPLPQVISSGLN